MPQKPGGSLITEGPLEGSTTEPMPTVKSKLKTDTSRAQDMMRGLDATKEREDKIRSEAGFGRQKLPRGQSNGNY